ncbi:MAG: protein kinase [Polaromonas sp.]|uniref:protein kinase domain-containing protein n=1 Tax=Polaromonas sp. TaxID=1869339 RepID=UPI003267F91B
MDEPEDKTKTLPVRPTGGEGRDVAALLPGQTVFEYRIEKMLGGGGFGITYLAQDINLQLPVAIKEYFPGDLAVRSPDLSVHVRSTENAGQFQWGLERFLDEARALASFRHPNIVRVLRYFKQNGTAYIVMEYESGDPLKRWLAKQPALDQQGLLKIVYPLMDGLEAVHKVNFLHRDIKPDNIYIRADGTPVLLDFGAARRVTGNQDLTNIVSPGFAPFEQYHSKGHQGPWTDIYSLGAVMYWMTTGHKPMESASRVREDSMPKAADTASAITFGAPLLRAIDWAMMPNETQRPQDVPAFRQALISSDFLKTQTIRAANPLVTAAVVAPPAQEAQPPTAASTTGPTATTFPRAESALLAYAANSQSIPLNSAENLRKNVLGTIMFLDLVSYSTYSVDQQVILKALFNELITKAIGGVKESSRIMIDTGDGAAICFLGDPEEALQSALLLRDLLVQKYGRKLSLRVGLHLGPIRMVFDINNRVNVVGDGINVAQRIMDFAKPGQIVVSRAYYDVISRITDSAASLFDYLGPHMDKHLRSHEIYAVLDPNAAPASPVPRNMEFEHTASFAALASLTPEIALEIENELAKAIGPLAKVLVKKAVPRTVSAQGLRELLAVSIPDATAREAFLKPRTNSTTVHSGLHGASGPSRTAGSGSIGSSFSRPLSSVISRLSGTDMSRPLSVSATPSATTTSGSSASINVQNFNAELQAQLERALSQHIGPLAKTLVRKEAARQLTFQALVHSLAHQIDRPDDRAKFLAIAQKMHGGR